MQTKIISVLSFPKVDMCYNATKEFKLFKGLNYSLRFVDILIPKYLSSYLFHLAALIFSSIFLSVELIFIAIIIDLSLLILEPQMAEYFSRIGSSWN